VFLRKQGWMISVVARFTRGPQERLLLCRLYLKTD